MTVMVGRQLEYGAAKTRWSGVYKQENATTGHLYNTMIYIYILSIPDVAVKYGIGTEHLPFVPTRNSQPATPRVNCFRLRRARDRRSPRNGYPSHWPVLLLHLYPQRCPQTVPLGYRQLPQVVCQGPPESPGVREADPE